MGDIDASFVNDLAQVELADGAASLCRTAEEVHGLFQIGLNAQALAVKVTDVIHGIHIALFSQRQPFLKGGGIILFPEGFHAFVKTGKGR